MKYLFSVTLSYTSTLLHPYQPTARPTSKMQTLTKPFAAIMFLLLAIASPIFAFQSSSKEFLENAREQLHAPVSPENKLSINMLKLDCERAIQQLSATAPGFILSLELQLPQLKDYLANSSPDPVVLKKYERILRRIVPGPNQVPINQLRLSIAEFRRGQSDTQTDVKLALANIEQLIKFSSSAELSTWSPEKDQLVRSSFEELHNSSLSPTLLNSIQQTISRPNVVVQVRKKLIENSSNKSYTFPLASELCKDKSHIKARGSVVLNIRGEIAQDTSSIPISIHVNGGGNISASVDRSPAHIMATLKTSVSGYQPLEMNGTRIERRTPSVDIDIQSKLDRAWLDGPMNHIAALRKLLSRIAQKQLKSQDTVLARKIEAEVSSKAEEEGIQLVNKINSLLTRGLWERFESIEFMPKVQLSANEEFIQSQSLYAFSEQLGALDPRVVSPLEEKNELDFIFSAHESFVNNILQALKGLSINEETVRGLWQVQFKMTHAGWDEPTIARVPTSISLSSEKSAEVHFHDHFVEFIVHLDGASSEIPLRLSPCTIRITYRLNKSSNELALTRDPLEFLSANSPAEQAAWQDIIEQYAPTLIHPMPRFRPSLWSEYVSLTVLQSQGGWFTVGLKSIVSDVSATKTTARKGTQR